MGNQQNKYNDDTDSVASLDSTGKRKSFRRLCERFAEKTSMQGIPYIHMAKLAWAKLIWTLLLLGALAGMIYHLKFLIATYVLFEKSTKIELGRDNLAFPAVTICNTNIIKQSLLEELKGAKTLKELVHDLKPDNLAKDQSPGGDTGTNEGGNTGTNQGGNTGTNQGGNTRPNQGGDTGTNDGGNTGTNQGGNTGTNQGGNTRPNQGGNTGTNDGGNTGTNQGGNTGTNQGGNTRPNQGGDTGTNDGGNTGTNQGGNTGTNQRGNTRPNQGGDTGTNDGGNTGTNQGGNTGTNQGGNTRPNQGGDTGTNDGGNTGTNQGGNTSTNEGGNTGTNQGGNTRPNQGGNTGTNGSGQNPPPRVRRQQPPTNNNNNNNNYEPPPEYRPPLHNFNVSKYDPDFNDALDGIDFDEDEYEDEYPIDAQAEAYDLFTELYMDLTKKERAQIGHNISEMLVSCSFGQRVCDHRQFDLYQTSEYGNCWTIKSRKFVSQRAGPSGGLQMVLFLNTKEYLAGITNGYGLRLLVHHGDTFPFPYDEGIFIPAAMETNIGLRLRTITRIGPPHGECNEGVEFKNKLKITYTRQACQVSCVIFKVLETCGCFEDGTEEIALSQIKNARPCRSTKEQRCLLQLLRKFAKKEETCTCLNPCHEVAYEQAISQRQWPSDDYATMPPQSSIAVAPFARVVLRVTGLVVVVVLGFYVPPTAKVIRRPVQDCYNFVKLNIYYADLNYENVTESPDIETSQFLSDVGGAIGLWIGLSLLSMCELGQLFVELFIYLVDRIRHSGERTERRRERQKNRKLKESSNPTNHTETNDSKGVIGIPDIKYDLDGSDRGSSRDKRYDSRFRNSPHGGPHLGPLNGDKSPRDSPRGSPWLERRGREEYGMRPPTRFYHEY